MKIRLAIIAALLFVFMAGCSTGEDRNLQRSSEGEKPSVYASIYPVYDFARNIGKDKINLHQITPPGAEPHDWEPTAKLMAELEKADIIIYNGAGMEPWIHRVTGSLNNKDMVIVDTSEGIELIASGDDHGEEDGHGYEGVYDPHIWLNPVNAAKQAENIKNALIAADKENAEFYEENYREYKDKLMTLDEKYKEGLKEYRDMEIVVAHAAFGYLAERYGLKQVAIKGVIPQEEPSPAKMAEITDLIKEKNIKYIFFEPLTNPRLSEVIARETGAVSKILNPLGGLTEEDINSGKDYISVMEENLKVLIEALGESK